MNPNLPTARRPLMAAMLVVLGVLAGGLWFYHTEERRLRENVETDLQAITQLKTDQIVAWRTERLGDAAVITESPFLVQEVAQWLADPSAEGQERLLARFRSLCAHYHYSDVLLVDTRGQVRLRLAGECLPLHAEATAILAAAVGQRRSALSDLHVGGTNEHPHLDLVAPLFAARGQTPERVGALILQVDAEQFLYPLIQSWPTHSQTAETLLVRQEGDAVLFLNDLHYRNDAALKLRIPLSQTEVPAVMAVLGRQGIVEGKDYRGVEVLSVLKAIPDSPWFMVAKEDVAEAFSIQRFSVALIVSLILALVGLVAVTVGVFWQLKEKMHYRALLEAEERFRVLFETAGDAIMTLEPPTWRFTSGNPATVQMFKTKDEGEFVSKGPWDFSPEVQPDGARSDDKAKAMIDKAMQEGSHFFEWDHKRSEGEVFPATVLLTRVTLGGRVFLQATVRDITVTKRAEKQIREHAQIQSALNGLLSLSLDDCTMEEVLGRAIDQMVSLSWLASSKGAIFLADDKQETLVMAAQRGLPASVLTTCARVPFGRCICGAAALSCRPEFADCVNERHENTFDGEEPHGHYAVPILSSGKVLGVINMYVEEGHQRRREEEDFLHAAAAVLAGIMNRKRAEEELAATAAQWDATFNSIADLVSIQDANHRLVRVNKAYAAAFGASPEQLTGRLCHEMVHGSEAPWPGCPCKTVFETKKPTCVDLFEPNLGIFLEVGVSPLFDSRGSVTGCVHIAKNITERKQAEQKQAELLEQLAEINQELKDFAYVVSHDLKAPLRAIRTLADWLIADYQDKLDAQGQENLRLLGSRVDRMQNLIDGVLQYSRLGHAEQETAPVDLSQVVPEIVENLAAPEHISIEVEPGLPTIEADGTRITQVFQNLLSNAIKYMDKPQGRITVGCTEEDGFWRFSVSDNGPGIEEKHFEKIFKLFQTLAPRDSKESTGVGLAIIKRVVEGYGGKIWVESQIGRGSTFFFAIPQTPAEVSHADREVLSA